MGPPKTPSDQLRYALKPGRLSSHGRILAIVEGWPRTFRILEVGTASGYVGRELRARGFTQIIGLEQDPQLASQATPHYAAVHVVDLDHEPELHALGRFDALVCADVLEHIRDPWRQLRRLSALIRPGGAVIISVPNAVNWTVRLMVLSGRFEYAERGLVDAGHLRFFTYRTARQLLEQAGLRIQRIIPTPLPIRYACQPWLAPGLGESVERMYYAMTLGWKTLLAYQFVLLAERTRVNGEPR